VTRDDLSARRYWKHCHTIPHERRDQKAYKKKCLSYELQFTDALSNERILLQSMIRATFLQPLRRCMVVQTGLATIFYNSKTQVLHVSARLPATRNQFYDFPHYPYVNMWKVTSGNKLVKQSHYRTGQAQRVPGS